MKFLTNLSSNIFGRSVIMLTLLYVLSLNVFAGTYANTKTQTLPTATILPTSCLKNSATPLKADGVQLRQFKQSSEQLNQFTNFTGLKTLHLSEKNRRSNLNLAEPIQNQFNLSVNSITFISANSAETRINRYANFLLKNTLKTVRHYSDANLQTNLKIFAKLPERNLKTLLTSKYKTFWKHRLREFAIGRTSVRYHKRE